MADVMITTLTYLGTVYYFTGKMGRHITTDTPSQEMEADNGDRIWVAQDGSAVWAD